MGYFYIQAAIWPRTRLELIFAAQADQYLSRDHCRERLALCVVNLTASSPEPGLTYATALNHFCSSQGESINDVLQGQMAWQAPLSFDLCLTTLAFFKI